MQARLRPTRCCSQSTSRTTTLRWTRRATRHQGHGLRCTAGVLRTRMAPASPGEPRRWNDSQITFTGAHRPHARRRINCRSPTPRAVCRRSTGSRSIVCRQTVARPVDVPQKADVYEVTPTSPPDNPGASPVHAGARRMGCADRHAGRLLRQGRERRLGRQREQHRRQLAQRSRHPTRRAGRVQRQQQRQQPEARRDLPEHGRSTTHRTTRSLRTSRTSCCTAR